jgi:hypothetical protein
MKLQILGYSVIMIFVLASLGFAFHAKSASSHAPVQATATETPAVAVSSPTAAHIRTHLESVALMQSCLVATIANERREGSYLNVYGTLSNSSNAALHFVRVTVTAYNSSKQVVNDSTLFPAASGYIQAGQTKKFSTMIRDEAKEVATVDVVVDPVDEQVFESALFQ